MVYDCTKETLTRFEPHGGTSRSYDNVTLDNELYTFVAKYPHIFSGGVPQVKDKLAGYQVKMGKVFGRDVKIEAGGFCSAWSQLILHRRILYPESTNQDIAEMFDTEPQVLTLSSLTFHQNTPYWHPLSNRYVSFHFLQRRHCRILLLSILVQFKREWR